MPIVKKHIRYEGINLQKLEIPAGLNISWKPNNEAIIEGQAAKLQTLKTKIEDKGGIITVLGDIPIDPPIIIPPPTQEEIDERDRRQQTKQNVIQQELDRINSLLAAKYTSLGGTGNPPKLQTLRGLF